MQNRKDFSTIKEFVRDQISFGDLLLEGVTLKKRIFLFFNEIDILVLMLLSIIIPLYNDHEHLKRFVGLVEFNKFKQSVSFYLLMMDLMKVMMIF